MPAPAASGDYPCLGLLRAGTEPKTASVMQKVRQWARQLKRDVLAIWIAARDPRTPLHVKILAGIVAAYALSPIDLIPDFIPVLGYLDDLILVPLGILLVVAMIPAPLMAECREKALLMASRPRSTAGLILIVGLWILSAGLLLWAFWPAAPGRET